MEVAFVENLIPRYTPEEAKSLRLHFDYEDERRKMTPDEFWEFCARNRKIRAELTKEGDVIIMPPTGFETGDWNVEIIRQLGNWAKQDGSGITTDSNAGYVLPSGATYAPDAAWTLRERLRDFSSEERSRFLRLCPDFVVELRSPSDNPRRLLEKMDEWLENGARLAWLVDPYKKQVHIYRPDREPEILEYPTRVSGEDVLPGFVLDLTEIW